jgi:acetolactate synthase-1/3 small subunit
MKYIYALAIVTENTTRVLQRMAGLFGRNRLNIEQLTVFETGNKGTSFFNIVVHADVKTMERVIMQLQKIIEVMDVKINSKIALTNVLNLQGNAA